MAFDSARSDFKNLYLAGRLANIFNTSILVPVFVAIEDSLILLFVNSILLPILASEVFVTALTFATLTIVDKASPLKPRE